MTGLQVACFVVAISAQPPEWTNHDAIRLRQIRAYPDLRQESMQAFASRGRAYLREKDFDRAIKELTEAIRVSSDFPEPSLYLDRGIAYSAKKDPDNAIRDFSEAIAIHMAHGRKSGYRCPEAYFHRGISYLARKKYHLGFDDLKGYWRVVTEKPSDSDDDY